jgi:hypothetical protein
VAENEVELDAIKGLLRRLSLVALERVRFCLVD